MGSEKFFEPSNQVNNRIFINFSTSQIIYVYKVSYNLSSGLLYLSLPLSELVLPDTQFRGNLRCNDMICFITNKKKVSSTCKICFLVLYITQATCIKDIFRWILTWFLIRPLPLWRRLNLHPFSSQSVRIFPLWLLHLPRWFLQSGTHCKAMAKVVSSALRSRRKSPLRKNTIPKGETAALAV